LLKHKYTQNRHTGTLRNT